MKKVSANLRVHQTGRGIRLYHFPILVLPEILIIYITLVSLPAG
jgi:hypothetical protein